MVLQLINNILIGDAWSVGGHSLVRLDAHKVVHRSRRLSKRLFAADELELILVCMCNISP